jgi:hypothetical protein
VLMEPSLVAGQTVRSIPDDIPTFCANASQRYQTSCYHFAGFLTYAQNYNVKNAVTACNEVPQEFQGECAVRVGEALFNKLKDNPQLLLESCEVGTLEVAKKCLFGVHMIAINATDYSFGELGMKLCSIAINQDLKSTCYHDLFTTITNKYGAEMKNKLCKELPDGEQFYCDTKI